MLRLRQHGFPSAESVLFLGDWGVPGKGYVMHCGCELLALSFDGTTPASFHLVDTLQKAKDLSCVFNNWAVCYKGKFQTVNLLDVAHLKKPVKQ